MGGITGEGRPSSIGVDFIVDNTTIDTKVLGIEGLDRGILMGLAVHGDLGVWMEDGVIGTHV